MASANENDVSSSTGTTVTPHVVMLRPQVVEEDSESSFDSIIAFLNEPPNPPPDMVHTTGAEYEEILGASLSSRIKNLSEAQKAFILEQVKEAKRWKRKYLRNEQKRQEYNAQIDEQKKKLGELQKEFKDTQEEVKDLRASFSATQKKFDEVEVEFQKFQKEVRKTLRLENEKKQLELDKGNIEREIRVKARLTRRLQKKLFKKVEMEKEVKERFSKNVNFIDDISKILKEKATLSAPKQEDLENSIVDWKMQLALYEDSNVDEIKALHEAKENKSQLKENDQIEKELIDLESSEDEFIEVEALEDQN